MDFYEQLQNYLQREKENHIRQVGRYYCSEIWAIKKGYLTPESFFTDRQPDKYGSENIAMGYAIEDFVGKVFKHNNANCEYQDKKEIKIGEITLVVKPDFNFKTKIIELKYPDSPMSDEIPDKWKDQLECEYRAFLKPVYLGIVRKHPLLTIVQFHPSSRRWANIQEILTNFHKKLCSLQSEKDQSAKSVESPKLQAKKKQVSSTA